MYKKIAWVIPVLLLMVTSVLAISGFGYPSFNIKVFEKNVNDWTIVEKGMQGNVLFQSRTYRSNLFSTAKAIVRKAEPYTDYTLIYYGDSTHNDEWDYATCITSAKTNKHGMARMPRVEFIYLPFVNDGIGQKFWIVPSSDVDCANSKMVAWNPEQYLFENTVL